jgi:hypothetical protein
VSDTATVLGDTIEGTRFTNTWSRRSVYSSDFVAPGAWILTHFYHITLWSVLVLCFLPSDFIPQFSTSILFTFIFCSMRATFQPVSSLWSLGGACSLHSKTSHYPGFSAVSSLPPVSWDMPCSRVGQPGEVLMTHRGWGATHRYIKVWLCPMRFCAFMKPIFIWQLTRFSFPLNMPFSYCTT